jgi:hypothetical protein
MAIFLIMERGLVVLGVNEEKGCLGVFGFNPKPLQLRRVRRKAENGGGGAEVQRSREAKSHI